MNHSGTPRKIPLIDPLCLFLATGLALSLAPAKFVGWLTRRGGWASLKEKKWTGAGIVGSIWGVLTFIFLPARVGSAWWALLAGFLISVAVSHRAEQLLGHHDDSRIVIDEWIGAWVACAGLNPASPAQMLSAFALFRVFDVLKGPWGHALQRLPGGWGVVMDDAVAGLIANLLIRGFLFWN
jgi:phosphatidylglycerophosphatase A